MRLIDADALLELFKYDENMTRIITNAPTIQREVQDKLAGWVSVEDKLPDTEGGCYLVYGNCTNSGYEIDIARFWMGVFEKANQPTHWQPLPAAPTETE